MNQPRWDEQLKPFAADNLKSITLAGDKSIETAEAAMDLQAGLKQDLKHATRDFKRVFKDLRGARTAKAHLQRLPANGEAYHCINRGFCALWDLVPAIFELSQPARIDRLHIATLGFSRNNVESLFAMLDSEKIGAVTLLCSHYFSATSAQIYEHAAAGMTQRAQRFLSMRTHAKLLTLAMSDGRRFVVEASANLRSCKNIEQFTVIHDAGLYDFHTGWIDGLFETNGRQETKTDGVKSTQRKRRQARDQQE